MITATEHAEAPALSVDDLLGDLIATLARACAHADRRRKRLRVHYARDGQARCGRRDAARVTAVRARVTCGNCLARLPGADVSRRWHDPKPCGTTAAYRRHKRRGEAPCRSCLQANARDKADRKAARKAARSRLSDCGRNAAWPLEAG